MTEIRAIKGSDRDNSLFARAVSDFAEGKPFGSLAGELTDLLGCEVVIGAPSLLAPVGRQNLALSLENANDLVAVVLSNDAHQRVLIEITVNLAALIADRALGGTEWVAGNLLVGDAERGALAFLAAHFVTRFSPCFSVSTVTRTGVAAGHAVRHSASRGAFRGVLFGVRIAEERGGVRVWLSENLIEKSALAPKRAKSLPVTLCVDRAEAEVPVSLLESLRPGDRFLFDAAEVFGDTPGEGRLSVLSPEPPEHAWWLRRAEVGFVVSRIGALCDSSVLESSMQSDSQETHEKDNTFDALGNEESTDENLQAALSAVGDVPVNVSLEVARFTMPLAELGRLAVGEVIKTGTPALARLRVGDAVVAEGELVTIETTGEVGLIVRRRVP